MSKLEKGLIQVYTGNGKGKSTAAIGQAIRSAGFGLKVYILQFMKDFPYNELNILEKLKDSITIKKIGKDDWVFRKEKPPVNEIKEAEDALNEAHKEMLSGNYDVIILDEVLVAIYFGLLTEKNVLEFIENKPNNVELILTGRYCPKKIIAKADLVTEMKEIKHYYQKGTTSRQGIDC
ncbi:MAG: cob(I)yrinic acid a,c-diamide adenosyltransferase [Ignavibacteriae bacterium]|nr:MAG: cob(I)yrinic acid a,c-diamide adenosyltransferase [Ignavibacteriota bacterium]